MSRKTPTTFLVLLHSPEENWVASLPFREQAKEMEHVNDRSSFLESKKLIMGGPFLNQRGGMMIYKTDTMEESTAIALVDPCVKTAY